MKKYMILLLSFLAFSQYVFANEVQSNSFVQQKKPYEKCNPHHNNEMRQRLQLDDAQKEQARNLRLNSQEKIKPLREELNILTSKKLELKSSNGDEAEIEKLNIEIKKLKQQIHGIIIQNEKDFVQILTPEQRIEFNKMRNEGKRDFHERKNHKKF